MFITVGDYEAERGRHCDSLIMRTSSDARFKIELCSKNDKQFTQMLCGICLCGVTGGVLLLCIRAPTFGYILFSCATVSLVVMCYRCYTASRDIPVVQPSGIHGRSRLIAGMDLITQSACDISQPPPPYSEAVKWNLPVHLSHSVINGRDPNLPKYEDAVNIESDEP